MFKAKVQLTLYVIAALAVCGVFSGSAYGGTGTSLGGATAPSIPVIKEVICSSGCLGLRKVTAGGTIQISGRNLSLVSKVSFRSSSGRVLAPASSSSPGTVLVTVPGDAIAGKLRARDKYGSVSGLSPRIEVAAARQFAAATGLRVLEAEVKPRKSYFFGARKPALSFVVTSTQPTSDLRVDVVRTDGQIVRSYFLAAVAAGSSRTVRWNGLDTAGKPAPGGSYRFLVRGTGGAEATLSRKVKMNRARASDAATEDPLGFELRPFMFPVQGNVGWGDGLGAGRGHQGQDLLTACGRMVYAARGGTVIYKGDMSGAAGNYVVISGKSTGLDFAYMHLLRPVKLKLGQTVRTGQVIGQVGATGRASTCHLHFEAWSAPGWYRGGSPVSPAGMLKKWYRQ